MTAARCFAIRRLDPFDGLTQVIQTDRARAFSRDGEIWQVQVEQIRPAPAGRGKPAQSPPTTSYLNTSIWTRRHGLRALPLDPMFELSTVSRLREDSETLAAALVAHIRELPFTPADRLELWLLRADPAIPMALLDSRLPGRTPGLPQHAEWSAADDADEALRRRIRQAAGETPQLAWIERDESGGGRVLSANCPLPACFSPEVMPALPLATEWSEPADRSLLEAWLRAQAPLLLLLHGLPMALRARLEHWAGDQALEVARWHHLYPEVADSRAIKRALVEAEMRRAHPQ